MANANTEGNLPVIASGIAIAEMVLQPEMLTILSYFLEYPNRKLMLVRMSDERQIIVSQSVAPQIASATPLQATQRKRADYWYGEDLADFNRDWRQSLEPNNPDSSLERSWRGFDPVTGENWRRFTNRFRLIEVAGQLYQLSESLGVESISKPISVGA